MEKIKGSGLIKYIEYVSSFAPLVTEPVKTGLVKKKMNSIKEGLINKLKQRHGTKNHGGPFNSSEVDKILKKELKEMKQHLSNQISQRGRRIVTTSLNIMGKSLEQIAESSGRTIIDRMWNNNTDVNISAIEQSVKHESISSKKPSRVMKHEYSLKKLMTHKYSPEIYADLIEHHDTTIPGLAIPVLEMKIGRPIKLLDEAGGTLFDNVYGHIKGDPLEIKSVSSMGMYPTFFVGSESFSLDVFGKDNLIHAVMKGAGHIDYNPKNVRREIASACRDKNHPCYTYFENGSAPKYLDMEVISAGKSASRRSRPAWHSSINKFLRNYGTNVQKIPELDKWNRVNQNGELGLKDMQLDICHILSWKNVTFLIDNALETKKADNLQKILHFMPTFEDVKEGRSIFGKKEGRDIFIDACDDEEYRQRAHQARDIVNKFAVTGKMDHRDKARLEGIMYNAPGNVRLGHSGKNRRIKDSLDYCPDEERSRNILKEFKDCEGFKGPMKNEDGTLLTSFYVEESKLNVQDTKANYQGNYSYKVTFATHGCK